MIITIFVLWGALFSIDRIKRQTLDLREEVDLWQEQYTEGTDERLSSLVTRLNSIEKELKSIRDAMISASAEKASNPDPVGSQAGSDDSGPQYVDSVPIDEDPQFIALSSEIQEALLAKRDQFINSLNESELDELKERTKTFVHATIQKTIKTLPQDL